MFIQGSPHNGFLCLSFSCSFIGFWALRSDWLSCFSVPFSLQSRAENKAISCTYSIARRISYQCARTQEKNSLANSHVRHSGQLFSHVHVFSTLVSLLFWNCMRFLGAKHRKGHLKINLFCTAVTILFLSHLLCIVQFWQCSLQVDCMELH